MGIGIIDYPPAPKVEAQENTKADLSWLTNPNTTEQQKTAVEMTQADLAIQSQVLAQAQLRKSQLEADRLAQIAENTKTMESALADLSQYVGKTRYVFSGDKPTGWDCSGLVRWFYMKHFGIELEHSATAQAFVGTEVEMPKPGDIVVFGYSNKDFYHAAIYLGDNKVIHSGFKTGRLTEVISLNDPSFDNSVIKFVRVVETN